jgi:hypothetical protein
MCDVPSTAVLVDNLLNASLVSFPDKFYTFIYSSNSPFDYWYDAFHIPHSLILFA